jgi:hypothetical protein
MCGIGKHWNGLNRAEEVRRLHDDCGDVVFDRRLQCFLVQSAVVAERNLLHVQAGVLRIGFQHIAIFGMQGSRNQNAVAPGDALSHEHCFGGRRRAVPHGSVRDFLPGELAHERLELEDRLQRPLRDLRLIRRIGSEKLAPLNNRVGYHRAQVIVDSRAQKAGVPDGIFVCALFEVLDDLSFGERSRQSQRFAEPVTLGDAGKKIIDRLRSDRGEHFLALGGALREIAHQAEASLPLSAMNAS